MAKKKSEKTTEGMRTAALYLKRQELGSKKFVITEHWVWGEDGADKFMAARQAEAHEEKKSKYQVSMATQAEYRELNWHKRRAA